MTTKVPFQNLQDIPKEYIQIVIVVVFIIGAYMLGSLKAKVDILEKGQAAGEGVVNSQQAAPAAGQPAQPLTADNVPPISNDDKVKGDRSAKVALIEYSDIECPFCKQFHSTAQRVVDEYGGDVMWVFRHYPLAMHVNAQKQSEAAECAFAQGGEDAFWQYLDTIFERTASGGTGYDNANLVPLAGELGLNTNRFQSCLDSGEMAEIVKSQMNGGTQAGVTGTPGNILLNVETGETRLIPGAVPFEQLQPAIDEMLQS